MTVSFQVYPFGTTVNTLIPNMADYTLLEIVLTFNVEWYDVKRDRGRLTF